MYHIGAAISFQSSAISVAAVTLNLGAAAFAESPKLELITCSCMSSRTPREIAEDHYYAALDLYADGKHQDAVGEYQRALEADPSFTEAMHGLARAYQDMQLYDDA